MKVVKTEKYLGDYISSEGLAHSVFVNVSKRKPQVMSSIFDIRTILEDCRANLVGGLVAGFEMWELSIVPFLLNNSETWVETEMKTLDILDSIQFMFLRYLFKTPRTCPKPALLWESGMLKMSHRIAIKKLLFFHHLINLPCDTLAYEILKVQESLFYPGLVRECYDLIEHYGLPKPDGLSKIVWKSKVKKCVRTKSRKELLTEVEKYRKLDSRTLEKEKFERKSYIETLNIHDARTKFALRSKMLNTVKMNFKGVRQYAESKWLCDQCKEPDTQEHLLTCVGYSILKIGRDLSKDKEQVEFYRQIVKLRSRDCTGT